MFIDKIQKTNQELLDVAFAFQQNGQILPDSYVIDMDILLDNAAKILKEAKKNGVELFFMLKQVGRNPYIARKLMDIGYEGAVVVDFKEARIMMDAGIPIGNVGHLVQIPNAMIPELVAYHPKVITVYSMEKLECIQQAAKEQNITQKVLLRVYDNGDIIYPGQTAGFLLNELKKITADILENYPNIQIAGVTSFPCYLYDEKKGDIEPTYNLLTVKEAVDILKEVGVEVKIVNTPSATCTRTVQKMVEFGGNCGEPGHGLTGTTPMHAVCDMEETPCIVYVSEISHNFEGKAYCYGGGHYRRSHMKYALVGRNLKNAQKMEVLPPSLESIDYHFELEKECEIGVAAVMAFRFQIFVTRSDVVIMEGIHRGKPEIVGVYDSLGRRKK